VSTRVTFFRFTTQNTWQTSPCRRRSGIEPEHAWPYTQFMTPDQEIESWIAALLKFVQGN
jgi:hypothetical protein